MLDEAKLASEVSKRTGKQNWNEGTAPCVTMISVAATTSTTVAMTVAVVFDVVAAAKIIVTHDRLSSLQLTCQLTCQLDCQLTFRSSLAEIARGGNF